MEEKIKCPKCGTENPAYDQFCEQCQWPLRQTPVRSKITPATIAKILRVVAIVELAGSLLAGILLLFVSPITTLASWVGGFIGGVVLYGFAELLRMVYEIYLKVN